MAIINSHWHLDHVSGNPDLKRAYPAAKVYASDAIDGALRGLLPKSAVEGRKYLDAGQLPPETLDDLKNDLATIDSGASLRPDVVVKQSGTLNLGGLELRVNLAPDAATDGDLWVFDPASKVIGRSGHPAGAMPRRTRRARLTRNRCSPLGVPPLGAQLAKPSG